MGSPPIVILPRPVLGGAVSLRTSLHCATLTGKGCDQMFTIYAPALQSTPIICIVMSPSDWIQLVSMLVTALVGLASIIIANCTLKQNNQMLEESTRPYITLYLNRLILGVGASDMYLIVKNYGASAGTIASFTANVDLKSISAMPIVVTPFSNIVGTVLAPGQSMPFLVKPPDNYESVTFELTYSSTNGMDKTYTEKVRINFAAHSAQGQARHISKESPEKSMVYALEEIAYKMM